MAYDHQNTHVNITILVVDDDPIILSVIQNMLKNPIYKDKSIGEITVMTAKDSSEALSKLRGACNKVDIVITDYHMPGLNGVQLKRRIDEEFGNLPVIVISADMNNPNGGDSTNLTNNPNGGDSRTQAIHKPKIKWTESLNDLFLQAIQHIGLDKAVPLKILKYMNVKYLTRAHIASKLQKYRKFLRAVNEKGVEATSRHISRRGVNSNVLSSGDINSQHSFKYSASLAYGLDHSDFIMNNYASKSEPSYDVGQSSFITNNNASMSHQPSYGVSQSSFMMTNNPSNSQLNNGFGQSSFISNNNASKSQPSYGVGQSSFTINNNASNSQLNYGFGQSSFMMNNNTSNSELNYGLGQSRFISNNNAFKSQPSFGVGQSSFMMNNNVTKSPLSYGVGQPTFMMNTNATMSQPSYGGVGQSNFMMTNNASNTQLDYGIGQSSFIMDNNAFKSQPSYGVGQSNLRMNNNDGSHDSIHYMNRRTINGLDQNGSDLMSMRKSFELSNRMLPLKEKSVNTSQDFQAPSFGQCGTTSNVLGTNSNLNHGYMGSNYVGIQLSGNGDLVAHGGIEVNGNGNSSLGENLSDMNWNSNNTDMSIHGSSISNFPSTLSSFIDNENQPHSNFIVQTDDVVPILENQNIFNDHHGINEDLNNTINSEFDQHQHHHRGEMTGENFGVSTNDLFEKNEIFAPWPLEDISNDNYNDETLNAMVADLEMQFPTLDMNIKNQAPGVGDSLELPWSFEKDWNIEDEALMNCLGDIDMN